MTEELPEGLRPGGRFAEWDPRPPSYVAADVDGTLLGDAAGLTDEVLAALAGALDAGLHVGFATGRMTAAVRPIWEQARLPGPHVLHNGALVRADGQTIASWPLEPEEAAVALRLCSEHGWYAEVYVGDGYFVTDRRREARVHWHMLHAPPSGLAAELDPDRDEILKITVAVFDKPADQVVGALGAAGLTHGAATSPLAPGVRFVNVTSREADKGRALITAAEHLGVPLEAVVAIGDGNNDLPMLAVAGTAIAMGQSSPAVVDAAHLVVPTIHEDGVARALDATVRWSQRRRQSSPGMR